MEWLSKGVTGKRNVEESLKFLHLKRILKNKEVNFKINF